MKLIIDIDEDYYKAICKRAERFGKGSVILPTPEKIILNGIPLPKNHGRLGDLDALKKEMQNYLDDCAKTSEYTRLGFETAIAVVEDADTIIEADKGENK